MNFIVGATKVFAVLFLIFGNISEFAAQPKSIFRLPAGTRIKLSMDSEISSKVASANDTFTATVSEPVTVRDAVVLPSGTVVEGRVVSVSSAGSGARDGRIELKFERIRFDNDQKREIDGALVNELNARSTGVMSVLTVLAGAAAGAVVGAVTKAENGALIGAGIGAGAGAGAAVVRKGKDVRIRTDEKFEIELRTGVNLPVTDY